MEMHERAAALVSPFSLERGGGEEASPDAAGHEPVMVVEAIEPVEIEYAALRRSGSAVVLDRPERGAIEVRGSDRLDFLNRMLTQELRAFEVGTVRRSLWLNRKGRIDADLTLVNLPDRLLMETDVFAVAHTIGTLREFVFAEDVEFVDVSERTHRLSLHGPAAAAVLSAIAADATEKEAVETIGHNRAAVLRAGVSGRGGVSAAKVDAPPGVVWRTDTTGEIGLELLVPVEAARTLYEAVSVSESSGRGSADRPDRHVVRRAGWHAYNIARLEAGTPLFRFDFGTTNLPHELGRETLADRVSFKKGCYLGQEVVARMESLGHPKQRLVSLRLDSAPAQGVADPLHADLAEVRTGCAVVERDEPGATVVGAVTSASMAPMLGGTTLALAMVRWSHAQEGTRVWVQVGGARLAATVRERLRAWPV